jgi:hypothetical protein
LGPKLPLGQEKVGGCDVVVLVAVQRPEMKKNAIETNLALRNFRKWGSLCDIFSAESN